jgi:hypothetical protein
MTGDPFAPIRESFAQYGKLPRQPLDRELANIAYLVTLHKSAPVKITHGDAHKALRGAVRTLLATLPGLITAAEDEARVAHAEGRTTDMDRFAELATVLLSAAEPFRAVSTPTKRRDRRSHWHGWARLMEQEIRRLFYACGAEAAFSHETSPGALVLADLIGKPVNQVVEALRPPPRPRMAPAGNKKQVPSIQT